LATALATTLTTLLASALLLIALTTTSLLATLLVLVLFTIWHVTTLLEIVFKLDLYPKSRSF
jgi:hypothetical protein